MICFRKRAIVPESFNQTFEEVVWALVPFLIPILLTILVLIIFPELVTYLPNMLIGG